MRLFEDATVIQVLRRIGYHVSPVIGVRENQMETF